ncbi:class I adenylate-forming enzyme family protein [Robertmurraya siralis]|uniref:class I adenylate-forming enzyme family protein n=1 Tax=Robertmurraya siralis TaxID=77777 RepID=UPI000BA687E9|nr:class I adenylate-forming enzyme family protein [Robertmurraya siralis]PAE18288.1 hypothetical protein CHH80_22490 [Bacillus sp. 7504-2]
MLNISLWLDMITKNYPNKLAIVSGGESLTYVELKEKVDQFASYLVSRGLNAGDRILIHLPNSIEAAVCILGTLKAGGIICIIHPNISTLSLEYIIEDSSPAVIITNSETCFTNIFNKERIILNLKDIANITFENKGQLCTEGKIKESKIAAIIYTSGSTGKPKGVVSTHRNIIFSTNAINRYLKHSPRDKIFSILPLCFDYGLYQLFISISSGATLYLEEATIYISKYKEIIENEKITCIPGIRNIFNLLFRKGEKQYPNVRYVTNTGDSLTIAKIKEIEKACPNAKLYLMYGLTECKRVSYLPPEYITKKRESVGIPIHGTKIKILNEQFEDCKEGQIGELYVSGPNVCEGYWNDINSTKSILIQLNDEIYLKTGDFFYQDNDGFLYFKGRKDNMFKSRGFRIEPSVIENLILNNIASVEDVVAVGIPDEIEGNSIAISVLNFDMRNKNTIEDAIMKLCKNHLEPWMQPKYISFFNSFPLTNSGKIDRKKMVEIILNELGIRSYVQS